MVANMIIGRDEILGDLRGLLEKMKPGTEKIVCLEIRPAEGGLFSELVDFEVLLALFLNF